ncbi:hypothetical protein BDP27DRAFT_1408944 [Rhodocollybia butyracea]|uniref:Uncharacterized protein n=1 Tax=Rhodocollybia butyracea TaxID=206335 RepID=A0A9P5P676_9AGAR|nr:hypothetical protein BDP27DRAFT_1408944 [Rhodocollybia butyracea]
MVFLLTFLFSVLSSLVARPSLNAHANYLSILQLKDTQANFNSIKITDDEQLRFSLLGISFSVIVSLFPSLCGCLRDQGLHAQELSLHLVVSGFGGSEGDLFKVSSSMCSRDIGNKDRLNIGGKVVEH